MQIAMTFQRLTQKSLGTSLMAGRRAAWVLAGFLALAATGFHVSDAWAQIPAPSAPPAAAAPGTPAEQAKAPALTNETCLGCHGVEGLLPTDRAHRGGVPGLMTDRFGGSVHGNLKCVDCHQNITKIPHAKTTVQVGCVECHKNLYENAKDEGKTDTKQFVELGKVVTQVDAYLRSIHAQPSMKDQSRTNATCYNCHDAHYIYPAGTANYNWWRLNLPYTCGKCHAEELKAYRNSVHGKEVLQNGNPLAAVCSDCHNGMDIQNPFRTSTQLAITRNCGNCHEEEWKSYLDTYHGQVNKLGFTFTAKCFNCHGSHTIQRVSDPSSTVFPANRLKTCQNCHIDAKPGFLSFEPHANTYNFARYPYTWLASKFMFLLLGGVFAFFWTHSALWYYREFRDHQQQKNRPHVRISELPPPEKQVYYNRWPLVWRTAHLLFAISVIVLVLTGMTLFYATSSWAPLISSALGGPRVTGVIHRIAAVAFVGIFFWHLAYIAIRLGPKWRTFKVFGSNSLVPNLQDIYDIFAMFKWFFGIAPKPNFDRWSYWEKFDYWAPFWGVAIIGGSGAMIWFKDITASYLPGWVFNVAFIFHGEEAVLAAGFLFTVHFFNNHWRPDKFPLDILMFTGRMPLEEFKREHAIEYQRLVESNQLDNYLVDAPTHPMTVGSKILGFTLMACGLILLYMVMSGFIGRLAT